LRLIRYCRKAKNQALNSLFLKKRLRIRSVFFKKTKRLRSVFSRIEAPLRSVFFATDRRTVIVSVFVSLQIVYFPNIASKRPERPFPAILRKKTIFSRTRACARLKKARFRDIL
jgi:hypothetical protein